MLSATSPLQVFLDSPFSVTTSSTSSCPLFRHLKKGAPHNLVLGKSAPEATGMLLRSLHLHIKLRALTEHRQVWSTGIHSQQGNPADKAPTACSHFPRSTTEGCLAFWLYPANFTTSKGARCPPRVPVPIYILQRTSLGNAPHPRCWGSSFPPGSSNPSSPCWFKYHLQESKYPLHWYQNSLQSAKAWGSHSQQPHSGRLYLWTPMVLHLALFEGFPSLPQGYHQVFGESLVLQPQVRFVKPCTSEASLFRQLFVRQEQGLQAEKCGGQGSPNKNTESH